MPKLWRSGVFFSAAMLVASLGNFAFQGIMGRLMGKAEIGYANTTNQSFITLFTLPLLIASTSVTHYIAHFHAGGDDARLQGLLMGCRRLLFRVTVIGSVVAVLLIKPLSAFFHLPRPGLMLVALFCVLTQLWSTFATALCQGLAWFRRLALIALVAMVVKLSFGGLMLLRFPLAETAIAATGVSTLAYLILLRWRKELARRGNPIPPWNREFAGYLAVGAACLTGGFCFTAGDLLVAQRNFPGMNLGFYTVAGTLGRALLWASQPMLAVLFTSRSGHRTGSALLEQLKLLGLYTAGLVAGAAGLIILRGFWVRLIFGEATPEAAAMVSRFAETMVFVALLQAVASWALASRWFKLSIFYGVIGVAYWVILLNWGKSPEALLRLMPVAAGAAFGLVFLWWLASMWIGHGAEFKRTVPDNAASTPGE